LLQAVLRRHPDRSCTASEATSWRLQSLFIHYRRILELNNTALELMSEMERALGGEYIFDRTFLETSVARLSTCVYHVVYSLNALTANAHVALYDRFQEIKDRLQQILAGGPPLNDHTPIISFEEIDWDMEPQVGLPAVCLTQVHRRSGTRIMDGFVVTAAACHVILMKECTVSEGGVTPDSVTQGIREHLQNLTGRPDGTPDDTGFTVSLVMAGTPLDPPAAIRTGIPAPHVVQTIHDLLTQALSSGKDICNLSPVVMVQEERVSALHGEVLTRPSTPVDYPSPRAELLEVTAHHPAAPQSMDRYLLRRAHPFDLVTSEIGVRPAGQPLGEGPGPFDTLPNGRVRGSALLTPTALRELAETALMLERLLGRACSMRWCLLKDGETAVCSVAPLKSGEPEPYSDMAAVIAQAHTLCRGGQTVQSGAAAGTVVHVTDTFDPQAFPAGAIAAAATASPRLAPLLQRAGAILTAAGTAAGHLATVARELRVPAIFGLPDLLSKVPAGARVTVDAGEGAVYDGILDGLLRYTGADLDPGDPEYRLLRSLLRFILPLHLVDPNAPDFTPLACRSYHDIIHFCHERAVVELANLQVSRPGLAGLRTRRLHTGVPLDMRILDIGGGLAPETHDPIAPDDIQCEPLSLFLQGLGQSKAWDQTPADLRLRDVFRGMSQTSQALNTQPDQFAGNLAIIAGDYLNLSLRLGYHFSVIDTLLGTDPQRNYVYFRFVGGLADARGRERRARFIHHVLSTLDFNVSQKGDLVTGRLKLAPPECLREAVRTLGVLTAFTRQRDTTMQSDSDPMALFERFSSLFLQPAADQTGDLKKGGPCFIN